jgi:two-component system, OmpR family, sensor histidine kinase KdpD
MTMATMANSAKSGTYFVFRIFVQKAIRLAGRVFVALGLVAAVTFLSFRLAPVNEITAGFLYLVAILLIATAGGLVESTLASIVAMLCFNYFFLPPINTLTISDPRNWVALFAFLATSLTASQLSARAKRRTREAIDRQNEIERLYSLSRALLLTDATRPIAKQIVEQIAQAFEFPAVALYDRSSGEIYRAGFDDAPAIDAELKEAAVRSQFFRDEGRRLTITPVRLGRQPIGSLAVRGNSLSDAALQSLLNLVAIWLERALSEETINRAEVARRSEELKSTLLDAIAHEFKTPLTSIKAVTTDLLSDPAARLEQHQRELISIADEGADRLASLVTEAIQLARIEGGKFQLNRGIHFPSSLISAALRQMKALTDGREIKVCIAEDLPLVSVDAALVQMVIAHLIDNALKYSPRGAPISIGARMSGDRAVIYVMDRGAGITEEEQSRIFDKFYRGTKEGNLRGTGMGLAIAREILRAHGQEIWVSSKPGEGSEFSFSLPLAPRSGNE